MVDVAEFFRNEVKHHNREPHDGGSEETKVLAIATLMKALGNVLWKTAELLRELKKTQAIDSEKDDQLAKFWQDKLHFIEQRYVRHLEVSGVFTGGRKKPELLYRSIFAVPAPECQPRENGHDIRPIRPAGICTAG